MDDELILELFRQRDEQAIERAREKYGAFCRLIAGNCTHDPRDAEECVNDALLAAWDRIPPVSPASLRAYLAGITRNLAVKRYEAKHASKRGADGCISLSDELSEVLASGEEVADTVFEKELARAVDTYLRTLPAKQRNVFLGRYYFGFSSQEIGKRLGIRDTRVRNVLSLTRKGLRAYLEKENLL